MCPLLPGSILPPRSRGSHPHESRQEPTAEGGTTFPRAACARRRKGWAERPLLFRLAGRGTPRSQAASRGLVRERAESRAGTGSGRPGSGRVSGGADPPGLAMLGARGGWRALRRCASLPRAVRLRVREALGAREPADAVRVQVCARGVPGKGPARSLGGREGLEGLGPRPPFRGGNMGVLQSVLLNSQISSAVVQSLSVCSPSVRCCLSQRSFGVTRHVQRSVSTVMGCTECALHRVGFITCAVLESEPWPVCCCF